MFKLPIAQKLFVSNFSCHFRLVAKEMLVMISWFIHRPENMASLLKLAIPPVVSSFLTWPDRIN